ncbi:MAG: V-type ATP synthase subunit A, partial [Candidatus Omnitrophica bacterium]|nr:V-type ATP synthase subunit A [Candidatus Omnitrophota bacterium]
EEGTSTREFIDYLKGEFLDAVYLQQNAFDKIDEATTANRQEHVYALIEEIFDEPFEFADKDSARKFFQELSQMFVTWNSVPFKSDEFAKSERQVRDKILNGAVQ